MRSVAAAAGPSRLRPYGLQHGLPLRLPAAVVVGVTALQSPKRRSLLLAPTEHSPKQSTQLVRRTTPHRFVSTEPVRPTPNLPPPLPPTRSTPPDQQREERKSESVFVPPPSKTANSPSQTVSETQVDSPQATQTAVTDSQKPLASAQTAVKQNGESEEESKEIAKKDKKKADQSLPARAWATVKKEAAHYWAGTKLLGHEITISSKLLYQVLKGDELTRRERRQLRRTTGDLLRLIPFSVFLVVPFMEFLLPVALRLFPNMLPSTFEGQFAAEEKERKLLRVRIEMAKFLQETVKDSGLKAESVVKSDEFKEFFYKVRTSGEKPSHDDVVRVAKLFSNDVALDNLSRPQLVSICRYMNINAWGTDNILKMHIQNRLEKIRVDDMMIFAEGVDSLSTKELRHASQSRGIRTQGVSPAALRDELQQWIDFHYHHGISGVLLILSRAFNFNQKTTDLMGDLVTTLGALPENLVDEAELGVSDEASYQQKLEVIQAQQELIDEEEEKEEEDKQERIERKEAEEAAKKEKEEATKGASETSGQVEAEIPKEPVDARMTKEQLGELAEALSILTAKTSIAKERDELNALLEDNLLLEAESKKRGDDHKDVVAVSKRVRSMINKIDDQLEKYDGKVGSSLNVIQTNSKGQVSLADLKRAFRVIKHKPSDEEIDGLGKKLDVDSDGFVDLKHVVELTQDRALGLEMNDEEAENLVQKGADIRHSKDVKDLKPKREDIIADE